MSDTYYEPMGTVFIQTTTVCLQQESWQVSVVILQQPNLDVLSLSFSILSLYLLSINFVVLRVEVDLSVVLNEILTVSTSITRFSA